MKLVRRSIQQRTTVRVGPRQDHTIQLHKGPWPPIVIQSWKKRHPTGLCFQGNAFPTDLMLWTRTIGSTITYLVLQSTYEVDKTTGGQWCEVVHWCCTHETQSSLEQAMNIEAQEIQLAPNSFGPIQLTQPITNIPVANTINGEGVIATADDGAPIINIDTSEQALQMEGLTVPADATRSLQPPPMQGQMGGYQQPIRRQRRSPSQPRYQQQQPQQQQYQQSYQQPSWGPPPQQQQMNGGRQGFEEQNEEPSQEYKSGASLKVIKMG
jgi:hypothetical protein